jgi:hypothetical protein
MLGYGIVALVIGWLLSLFGFDKAVIYGSHTLFGGNINIYVYYLIFFAMGIIGYIIDQIAGCRK